MNISKKYLFQLEAVLQSIFEEGFDYPDATVSTYKHDVKNDVLNLVGYVDEVSGCEDDNANTISFLAEDLAGIIHDMGQAARKEAMDRQVP